MSEDEKKSGDEKRDGELAKERRGEEMKYGIFYKVLGGRICETREKANVTQEELARVLGICRTTLTNIEKGRRPIFLHHLLKIADCLCVPFINLFEKGFCLSDQIKTKGK